MTIGTTPREDDELVAIFLQLADITVDAQRILDWIADNFVPGRVYPDYALEDWALGNGFIRIDEVEA